MDKVRANVYLDREVKRRAKVLAEWMGLSFSEFVNIALFEYLYSRSLRYLMDWEIKDFKEVERVLKGD